MQLQNLFVSRKLEINDKTFLKVINTILDIKSQSDTMLRTEKQRAEIAESKKQIEQGLFFDQEEMNHQFEKWHSEK